MKYSSFWHAYAVKYAEMVLGEQKAYRLDPDTLVERVMRYAPLFAPWNTDANS